VVAVAALSLGPPDLLRVFAVAVAVLSAVLPDILCVVVVAVVVLFAVLPNLLCVVVAVAAVSAVPLVVSVTVLLLQHFGPHRTEAEMTRTTVNIFKCCFLSSFLLYLF
jgi:hypothetical protein